MQLIYIIKRLVTLSGLHKTYCGEVLCILVLIDHVNNLSGKLKSVLQFSTNSTHISSILLLLLLVHNSSY